MTDVRKTHIYKTLLPCIRRQDRKRFREELQRAADAPGAGFHSNAETIDSAFAWWRTPQGLDFWCELDVALRNSGNYAENGQLRLERRS